MSARVLAAVWVPGVPRTKGSLDRRMQDTPASKAWRSLLAAEFRRDSRLRFMRDDRVIATPYGGPVAVRCIFVRSDGVGDLDKLERNVLDALTDSGVIGDDVQVVTLRSDRVVKVKGRCDGAFVLVATVDERDDSSVLVQGAYGAEIDAWVTR